MHKTRYFILLALAALPALGGQPRQTGLCGLMIAGHAQVESREMGYELLGVLARQVASGTSTTADAFLERFPTNELYERTIAALVVGGTLTPTALSRGEPIPGDAFQEAALAQIASLHEALRRRQPIPPWLAVLRPPPATVDVPLVDRSFASLGYAQLLELSERSFETRFRELAAAVGVPPERAWENQPRQAHYDALVEELFSRQLFEPAHFEPTGRVGARIIEWSAGNLLASAMRTTPFPPRSVLAGRPVPYGNHTFRRFLAEGYGKVPHFVKVSNRFWRKVLQSLEVNLLVVGGPERVRERKVLDFDEPGFTLQDLHREVLYELLQWRVAGNKMHGNNGARKFGEGVARSFLTRRGFDLVPPVVATAGAPAEAEDDAVTLRKHGVFLYSVLADDESTAVLDEVKKLVRAKAPGLKLEPDDIIGTVRDQVDVGLAFHWASRPRSEPTGIASIARLPVLVDRAMRQRKSSVRGSGAEDVELRRWRLMAVRIPGGVRALAPHYFVDETIFWARFSDADALEAVGAAAAEWRAKGYRYEATVKEPNAIADRGLRVLLSRLARERKTVVPDDWAAKLARRETDTTALFDLVPEKERQATLVLWRLAAGEDEARKAFEALYVDRVPSIVFGERNRPAEGPAVEVVAREAGGFDRFLLLRDIVRRCPRALAPEAIARRGWIVFEAERRARELSLVYLSRAARFPLGDALAEIEAWVEARTEPLDEIKEEDWRAAVDTGVRRVIAARAAQGGSRVSPSQLAGRQDETNTIPAALLVVPSGADIDDIVWKRMMQRLDGVLRAQAEVFQLTVDEFWGETAGYDAPAVASALIEEFATWRRLGLKGNATLLEETEVLRRTIRRLCAQLFHRLGKEMPADVLAKVARNQVDRVEVYLMIPEAERTVVKRAWDLALGEVWRDERAARLALFDDLFVLDLPVPVLLTRHSHFGEAHQIYARRGRYFESFYALWKKYRDPKERFALVLPPEPVPYSPRVWGWLQKLVAEGLARRPEAAAEGYWERFGSRHTAQALARFFCEAIEAFTKRSESEDTQRRHADAIAKKIVERLAVEPSGVETDSAAPAPVVAAPAPVVATPEPVVATPEPVVATPEPVLTTPRVPARPPVEKPAAPPRPRAEKPPTARTPSPRPSRDGERAVPVAADLPRVELPREALLADVGDLVSDLASLYGLEGEAFRAAEGGYGDGEVEKRILEEATRWQDSAAYRAIPVEDAVDAVRERAVRSLLGALRRKKPYAIGAQWDRDVEQGDTDLQAIVDCLPPTDVEALVKRWSADEDDGEWGDFFRRSFLDRDPYELLHPPRNPVLRQSANARVLKEKAELAFYRFVARWRRVYPPARPGR